MSGLSKSTVDKIRDAFVYAHEIWKSIEGWPTCTIYKPILYNSPRLGSGEIHGITIAERQKEIEWDQRQTGKVATGGVEDIYADITFIFYNYKLPDLDYRIAIGQFIESLMNTTTGKGGYGPVCPQCNGYGRKVSNELINGSYITVTPEEVWNNPYGDTNQCGYCGGLGLDIHDERVKFYGVLRHRPDERMVEWEYDMYLLPDERHLITSSMKESYDDDSYVTE